MNLIKKLVTHRTYGQGSVVDLSDSFVEIQFDSGNKKFVFPDAFGTHLVLKDRNSAEFIKHMKEKRELALKLEEIKAAQLEEQQIRIRNESLLKNLKIHPSSQAVFWCHEDDQKKVFEEWGIFTDVIKSGEKKGKANRPARLHQNSACLLTKRDSSEPEKERRILGAFMVSPGFVGKLCEDGIIHAHEEYRLQLTEDESDKMFFWNYYVNEKALKSMTWNTGRYRYFDNILMAQMLKDIASMKKKTPEQDIARRFFEYFCEINRIDKSMLPKPNGARMRV